MSEGETVPVVRPRKSRAKKVFFYVLTFLASAVVLEQFWYHHTYPYGWSHCCDIRLGMSLQQYAQDHGGRFPTGEDSPEASLSLLYSNYTDAYMLRGKTVPLKTVEQAIATKGKLGPESCGWHYVEGLTLSDDNHIAIVWDKVGLGHNGQRMKGGGHSVIFVDGARNFISEAAWPQFLRDQEELLAHRSQEAKEALPGLIATIRLPTGEMLTNCNDYELTTSAKADTFSIGSSTESGSHLDLEWYRVIPDEGEMTWVLTLPGEKLRSKPVIFTVKNGRASPPSIVFEMEKY